MDTFFQQVINGLSLGAIYALIALGYTMVYGVLRLINFAHGDVYMLGAFAGYFLANALNLDANPSVLWAIAVTIGSMAICAGVGLLIERLAYRPVRHHSRLTSLITAIGVSLLLEYGVLGAIAGTIGALGAIGLSWAIAKFALELPWTAAPALTIGGIFATAGFVAAVGVLASVDVLRHKPLATLRAE